MEKEKLKKYIDERLAQIEYSIEHSDEQELEDHEETEYRIHLTGMRQALGEIKKEFVLV